MLHSVVESLSVYAMGNTIMTKMNASAGNGKTYRRFLSSQTPRNLTHLHAAPGEGAPA